MKSYCVNWSILVDAENFEEAASIAFGQMQDPENEATYLHIEELETEKVVLKDFEEIFRNGYQD